MGSPPAEALMRFTSSIGFDIRLGPDDITGSVAHVRGLERAGLMSAEDAASVLAALARVEVELTTGEFEVHDNDEDIHMAIERRVVELVGEPGERMHTGRSRNDQVATTMRLFSRRELAEVAAAVLGLQRTLLRRAVASGDAYLPGYTHMQRAQPVLLAHHLLAHGWALARDVDRLISTIGRLDVSPLGAGALGGSSLPLDPEHTATELGFDNPFDNSIDAVADRDFIAEALFDLALLGVHLSRLGEEIMLFSTDEFGFIRLDDAWATGSSMLPQKKNPDVAELIRGKAGRLIGHLSGFLATLKGLPLSYNRDLQEDKEPLFDSIDQVTLALGALDGLISTLTFDTEVMQAAADGPAGMSIDLAEWLVAKGIPFRQAHGVVGALIRETVERHVDLRELVEAHPELGSEALSLFEPGASIRRRATRGGSGPAAVADQIARFEVRLEVDEDRVSFRRD
jgi:argininosuccinate lyase